ncbi:unnamed protein product [Mytilus edulis]|uniref:Uncharacterized protein n=1 Tax=Mytilus edulis TaxID=6550 RepID=A0A8S3SGT5_MYTED|nr:unnamed protein product [Mytilus edulis]
MVRQGYSPLHEAVLNENVDIVKLLVSLDADVRAPDIKGDSPLHYAALNENFDIVKILVSLGADVSVPDIEGHSPLHYAALNENVEMVKLLVSLGANLSVTNNEVRDSPLHKSARNGKVEIVKLLVSLGADLSTTNKQVKTPLVLFEEYYNTSHWYTTDDKGGSPLHQATNQEEQNIVEVLVSLGANMSARNNEGNTPLHQAVGNGQLTMVKALTCLGADITVKNNEEKKDTIEKTSEQLTVTSKKETAGNDSRSLPIARKSIEKDKDIHLPWLVNAKVDHVRQGRVLSSVLIGEDIPLQWNSTDGLVIFFGRNGIDIENEKMIPLEEGNLINDIINEYKAIATFYLPNVVGERGHEILAKILRGKPNVYEQHEHKIRQQPMRSHSFHSQAELINKSSSASSIIVTQQGKKSKTFHTHQVSSKCNECMTEYVGTKVSNKGMLSVPTEIKSLDLQTMQLQTNILQEVRDGKYKIKIAPSDLIDFGGQKSYDMTHQLFIQHRGSFLLMFDGRFGLHNQLAEYQKE